MTRPPKFSLYSRLHCTAPECNGHLIDMTEIFDPIYLDILNSAFYLVEKFYGKYKSQCSFKKLVEPQSGPETQVGSEIVERLEELDPVHRDLGCLDVSVVRKEQIMGIALLR